MKELIFKNTTIGELEQALVEVNKKYDNNIVFREIFNKGKNVSATLYTKDTQKAGHRVGFVRTSRGNRRKLPSACWHVHGDLFDAILKINENVVIKSSFRQEPIIIDKNGGNWQDWNIGSNFDPLYFSEACDCVVVKSNLKTVGTKIIKQSELTAECWLIQFDGLKACEICEAKGTDECGGKKIRETLKNEKGVSVPLPNQKS